MAASRILMRIESEQATYQLLSDILNGRIDAENIDIDFTSASWATFDLKLTGENYKSTINADLMRALIEYQNTLYRVAAYVKNGKLNAAALDEEYRENLRLNFHVAEGSSEFTTDLVNAFSGLADKVTAGMGSKTKAITVLAAILMICGTAGGYVWVDRHYKFLEASVKSEEHKEELKTTQQAIAGLSASIAAAMENQKTLNAAIATLPILGEIDKQAIAAKGEILRQSADADSVRLQQMTIPGHVVRSLTGQRRRAGANMTLEGTFIVESVDFTNPKGFICKIKRVADGIIIQATMQDALMSENSQRIIEVASWSKAQVRLSLTARQVGSEFRSAKITSAKNIELVRE